MADELAAKLARRAQINDGEATPELKSTKMFNPFTEFPEFSRKEVKNYEKMFKEYDTGKDNFIDLQELKFMMEKLGAPQTHVGLKAMIKEVDEDYDGKISFREFLLIFRKAARGELQCDGLSSIASSVDVAEVGVTGAKGFFDGLAERQASQNKFELEIKAEQEEKKKEAEAAKQRKADFKAKMAHLQ